MSQSDTPASLDELRNRLTIFSVQAQNAVSIDEIEAYTEATAQMIEALITESNRQARLDELHIACHYWEENPLLPATYMIDRTEQLQKPADKEANHEQSHTKGE